MRAVIALFLLVVTATVGAGAWAWWDLHRPGPELSGPALMSIEPREPFRRTAEKLGAVGVVRHPTLLHWYARLTHRDRLIHTGDYRFEEAITPIEVLESLRSGSTALTRVTIPEGFTIRQTAAQLVSAGFGGLDEYLCAAQDTGFLKELDMPATGLEGYLFPDTYSFPLRTAPRDILRTMVRRFRDQLASIDDERAESSLSDDDAVTLASIIEKETAVAEERSLVAGVFRNRLRIGMRLQSDPTATYGWKEGPPTAADLRVDSPYNTYLHAGLPPGPICNPGLAAIRAAYNPTKTPYLYFVARGDGTHNFSTNLDEHNRAVAAARR